MINVGFSFYDQNQKYFVTGGVWEMISGLKNYFWLKSIILKIEKLDLQKK